MTGPIAPIGMSATILVPSPGRGPSDFEAAGVMDAANFLPSEVPSHWAVYFAVDDAEATIATAVELGATVVHSAEVTPYGVLATLADPTGAMFKLQQPS